MTIREDYDASKARLNSLSDSHRAAMGKAAALKIQLDDAESEVKKLAAQLLAENEKYMELEKAVEEEKGNATPL